MVTIIYLKCNDSIIIFKYCCSKNVFIYLDVTDYLKILDFFFFSRRCSVLFSIVITMKWLTSVIYYYNNYYYCNDIASIVLFCFIFVSFKNSFFCHHHHLFWGDVSKHTGIYSVNVVVLIDDRWNVERLRRSTRVSQSIHLYVFSHFNFCSLFSHIYKK